MRHGEDGHEGHVAGGQGAPSTFRCVHDFAPWGRVVVLGPSAKGWRSAGAAVAPRAGAPSAVLRLLSAVRCAHKGPELGNAVRTQGRDQAVVCGVVLRNSVPCVRNRDLHTKEDPRRHRAHPIRNPRPWLPASANYVPEERLALLRFRGAGALWRPRLDAALGGRGCLPH